MALELFKPFVMKRLVDLELAQNIKTAKRMVERRRPQVWDVLEDVIKEHPVLLNRAPTLHRLGIQAFEPVLVEGKALQIHPLVCTAFNADFDGDQMAIHVPLSAEAQAEARVLMLSANNILSPASGRPIVTPTQDLVIGAYYLTEDVDGAKGEGRVFRHLWEALRAYDEGGARPARHDHDAPAAASSRTTTTRRPRRCSRRRCPTTTPSASATSTSVVKKREMGVIVERLSDNYPKAMIASSLDAIKNLCYRYASQSGLTVSIDDVKTPAEKRAILDGYEEQADKVENQFRRGIITDGERRQQEVRIWTDATAEVQEAMEAEFKAQRFNPIDMMVGSGARGNMTQMRQIAGMRGLVANPRGDMIPRPIKKNFREGLETLEYFIATPGARKGLVDTALRTADSGYLTRRLVDVAQELIVREDDCGTTLGVWVENVEPDTANRRSLPRDQAVRPGAARRRHAGRRHGAASATRSSATTRWPQLRDDPAIDRVRVRSVLDVRRRARRVRHLLRPLAGHRQVDRARRGRRRHRRPVDRRARHAADDADVPHRWCRRQGHRRRSAPRRRAVRGPHPAWRGPPGQASGVRAPRRGRGQGHPGHRRRRRRRGARGRSCRSAPARSSATARRSRPVTRSPTAPSTRRS